MLWTLELKTQHSPDIKESTTTTPGVPLLPSFLLLSHHLPRHGYHALVHPKGKFGAQHVPLTPAAFFSRANPGDFYPPVNQAWGRVRSQGVVDGAANVAEQLTEVFPVYRR